MAGEAINRGGWLTKRERSQAQADCARGAWVLAADLASETSAADVRATIRTRGTRGRGGDNLTTRARRIACYLAMIVADCRAADVAAAAGMDPTTVRASVTWVEDARAVDPLLDGELETLERRMILRAAHICLRRLAYLDGEAAA